MPKYRPTIQNDPNLPLLKRIEVLRPAHGGTCFAVDESGNPLFVSHALPGEVVDVQLTKKRAKVAFADAVEIHVASAHRQPHIWSEAGPGGVGGADLGHVKLAYQRTWKAQVIADQLKRIGSAETIQAVQAAVGEITVRPASGETDGLHSRSRVEFEVADTGRLAMAKAASNELLEISDMPLADEAILNLNLFGDSPWKELWRPGNRVRALAPSGDGERVVIGNKTYTPNGRRVENFAQWQVSYGEEEVTFSVHTQGFWQAHKSAPQDLVQTVIDAAKVNPGDAVLELFSGAGLFTYFLATATGKAGRLISIEGSAQAVDDASHNLRNLDTPRDLRVGNVNGKAVMRAWSDLGERPRVVVLDPPRAGAGRELIQAIATVGPETVVLVSCDPAAGARDIRFFLEAGYQVRDFQATDFFPHTHHVETVCVLEKA
ncbi:TRAM domain-containing protein [Gleimia sp. 6138-11-ORH1]|uniref:class I SAM-dependent RNA methyltransferase n=1 Tax=Gleimia sp. 6138-11-ORH1 TaxID=2973937 RepID=UPI002169C1CF|nr:TRAM domain-containing protein [Gleimia sp. 6138-11-ORH1]MCS4484427.1 TRAM domain-containing protein [Gleimia sp. 6138-11-ORH1]